MANNRQFNQAMYLGTGLSTYNVATLDYPGQLGQFFEKDGCIYQLVQVDSGSNALAINDVVFWSDFDDFKVSNDVSDMTGLQNRPAGVAVSIGTISYYCFIQVKGPATVRTNQDDDIAQGDTIIMDLDEDGQCDSVALGTASTHIPLGIATAADDDTADTVATYLCPPLNGA